MAKAVRKSAPPKASATSKPRTAKPAGNAAGYSGTPLPKKLGFKPGMSACILGEPPEYRATLGALPEDVAIATHLRGKTLFEMIHLFTRSRDELAERLPLLKQRIVAAGMIWVSWPKKSSGVATDITEDVIRDIALPGGLVDIKVCAIDAIWSGLKLVIPVKDRPKA